MWQESVHKLEIYWTLKLLQIPFIILTEYKLQITTYYRLFCLLMNCYCWCMYKKYALYFFQSKWLVSSFTLTCYLLVDRIWLKYSLCNFIEFIFVHVKFVDHKLTELYTFSHKLSQYETLSYRVIAVWTGKDWKLWLFLFNS